MVLVDWTGPANTTLRALTLVAAYCRCCTGANGRRKRISQPLSHSLILLSLHSPPPLSLSQSAPSPHPLHSPLRSTSRHTTAAGVVVTTDSSLLTYRRRRRRCCSCCSCCCCCFVVASRRRRRRRSARHHDGSWRGARGADGVEIGSPRVEDVVGEAAARGDDDDNDRYD